MEVHPRQKTRGNWGIPRKDKSRRNSVPQEKAHQLVIQYTYMELYGLGMLYFYI